MRRFAVVLAFDAVGCGRFSSGCRGDYCGTLIFAAAGQPDILLPPVTESALARDIHDQLFLKLADLGMSTNTIGDRDFTPQLAQRWEWTGPKTLVFHLDPRARWQDGRPVTAGDVAFTFAVYTDPKVGASSRESLRRIASVTARDSLTAVFQFTTTYAEMFYDAVYDMRILPAHLLEHTPREQLSAAPFGRAPIGDGPYRFVSWRAGESIELAADSTFFLGRPHIRRLIWRFSPDLNVAITQLIAGQADAIEVLGPPDNVKRVRQAPDLVVDFYRGSVYGYLAFNLARPVFGDRDVRRAFVMAVDRGAVLHSVFGGGA